MSNLKEFAVNLLARSFLAKKLPDLIPLVSKLKASRETAVQLSPEVMHHGRIPRGLIAAIISLPALGFASSAMAQVDSDSDGIPDSTENQCSPGLALMQTSTPQGELSAVFSFPDGTQGTFLSTVPTEGVFNTIRPEYNPADTYALALRGGGNGASTTISFDQPLGAESQFLVADVNFTEAQEIIAYANDVAYYPIALELNDGAELTGDNNEILQDGDGDSNFDHQASLLFSFEVAIDRLEITSVGTSDWISLSIPKGCSENADLDGDTLLNRNDADSDGDGILDIVEAYDADHDGFADSAPVPGDLNPPLPDTDGDQTPDFLDTDDDGDGLFTGSHEGSDDLDQDGIPDYLDDTDDRIDSDGDNVVDEIDQDDDNDGIRDEQEGNGAINSDDDDLVDSLDTDSDGDQVPDAIEGHDVNQDGVADVTPTGNDEDNDGLDDAFDTDAVGGVEAPLPNTDLIDFPDFQDADDDNDGIATADELLDSDDEGSKPDYLESIDTDGDSIADHLDLDNDNDTIWDLFEGAVDTDEDTLADYLDLDSDNDGLTDQFEVGGSCVVSRSWLDVSTIDADDEGVSASSWSLGWTGSTSIAVNLSLSMVGNPAADVNWQGTAETDAEAFWAFQSSAYQAFIGAGPVYQLTVGDSQAGEDAPVLADYQFASALPAHTYLIVEDVDTNGEYVHFMNGNGPASVALQLPRLDMAAYSGSPLYFPLWDSASQMLSDGAASSDSTQDVTVFDVSGLSRLQIESGRLDLGDVSYALLNFEETCLTENDSDGDQTPDFQDIDDDGDSVDTLYEGAPAQNTDSDSLPDYLDTDDDGDELLTIDETPDQNGDGNPSDALNSDGDGVADYLQHAADSADLALTMIGAPLQPVVGSEVFMTLSVRNLGPDDASDVVVGVDIPEGYTMTLQTVGEDFDELTNVWAVGDLADGGQAQILFRFTIEEIGGRIITANILASSLGDLESGNNTATFSVTVVTDPNETDTDNDGVLDIDDLDDDNDGILDSLEMETAPSSGPNQGDTDGDNVPDHLDLDSDGDLVPDVLEAGHGELDSDGDFQLDSSVGSNGYADALESDPGVSNYALIDTDFDGQLNYQDTDDDDDGVKTYYEGGIDQNTDGTGFPDFLDDDDDDDGFATNAELGGNVVDGNPENALDSDEDGTPDYLDAFGVDSDGDQVADEFDKDDDNDGILDILEVETATHNGDTDEDGLLDHLDLDSDNDGLSDLFEAGHTASASFDDLQLNGEVGSNGYLNILEEIEDGFETGTPTYFLLDTDGDDVFNFQDQDDDGDSILTEFEAAPDQNTDDDALPDYLDDDDDNDAIPTADEHPDDNGDGNPSDAINTDDDDIPDYLDDLGFDFDGDQVQDTDDLDDDNDGIPDAVEGIGNTDGDDLADNFDSDSDDDGLADYVEAGHGFGFEVGEVDEQGFLLGQVGSNGLLDILETSADSGELNYVVLDTDAAGVPNFQTRDEDGDGLENQYEGRGVEGAADQDTDNDGLVDYLDADDDDDLLLTIDENADPNGLNGPDDALDSDGDQVPDYLDSTAEDHDGDNVADTADLDDDNDGILDILEEETAENNGDTDGDNTPDIYDLDSDGDAVPDYLEAGHGAPADAQLMVIGEVGSNGFLDALEDALQLGTPNYFVRKTDNDGAPDFQDWDDDNDGLNTEYENAPAQDSDGDQVPDYRDDDDDGDDLPTLNELADPDQNNIPDDAFDSDWDGVPDYLDILTDTDGDQVADADDLDDDNDGLLDTIENATALGQGGGEGDTDGDQIPDRQDLDSDNDGLFDAFEAGHEVSIDANGQVIGELGENGFLDSLQTVEDENTANFFPRESDIDDLPDFQDNDDDDDGLFTIYENAPSQNTDDDAEPDYRDADDDGDSLLTVNEQADPNQDGNPDDAVNTDDDAAPDYLDALELVPTADLQVTILGLAQADEGEQFYVNVTVNNAGPDQATAVSVAVSLPNALELQSSAGIGSYDEQTGIWSVGSLGIGNDNSVTLLLLVEAIAGGDFDAAAVVFASEQDLNASNNSNGFAITIIGADDSDGDQIPDDQDIDDDNDGLPDALEQATALNDGDTDGDNIADQLDLDSDDDGKWDFEELGHFLSDTDGDHRVDGEVGANGFLDELETANESGEPNYDLTDVDGDALPDFQDEYDGLDTDGDNVKDDIDIDDDNDGILDSMEISLSGSGDTDDDGIEAELDLDSDGDQVPDYIEAGHGLTDATAGQLNGEVGANGFLDALEENENGSANYTLSDFDADTKPNFLDKDDDNDGVYSLYEGAPNQDSDGSDGPDYLDTDDDGDGADTANEAADPNQDGDPSDASRSFGNIPDYLNPGVGGTDSDGDNFPDAVDLDDDGDGIPDSIEDAASQDYQGDTDGDNTPDRLDLDSDNDLVFDVVEAGHGVAANAQHRLMGDMGNNGFLDSIEFFLSGSETGFNGYILRDSDSDGDFNFVDSDDDNDGLNTQYENAPEQNSDDDDLPDYLDDDDDNDGLLTDAEGADPDGNHIPEANAQDTDNDGVPDYLDSIDDLAIDTDGDQIADLIDIDDDNDGILDSVEEANSSQANGDSDGDNTIDRLDLDSDNDGVPDAAEAGHAMAYVNDMVIGPVGDNGLLNVLEASQESGTVSYSIRNTDGDSLPNYIDQDDDGDGLYSQYEGAPSQNSDDDVFPDYLDNDDDNDSILTQNENPDPNNNHQPEDAEDADGNSIADYLEVAQTSDVYLALKVFLQGPLEADSVTSVQTDGLMWDRLREKGLLPENEPYTNMADFNHVGSGGQEVATTGAFDVTGSNAIVDWIFVELRSSSDSSEVVATRAALLQRDGDVVDVDGTSALQFVGTPSGEYKVAVRHRNHLGVMKGDSVILGTTPVSIDFTQMTDDAMYHNASGDPAQIQLGLYHNGALAKGYGAATQGKRALWAGNAKLSASSIEFISQQGGDNDRDKIYFDVSHAPNNGSGGVNHVFQAYSTSDTNLDGDVRFQGGGLLDPQIGFVNLATHPKNSSQSFNFIATEQLP